MKKNVILAKIAIAAVIAFGAAVCIFASYGIASMFSIQYHGMSYIEYSKYVYSMHPVLFPALEAATGAVVIVCGTNSIYNELEEGIKTGKF